MFVFVVLFLVGRCESLPANKRGGEYAF